MARESYSLGEHIGDYRLIAELASGSFATVYLAQPTLRSLRFVAIKCLHAAHLDAAQKRERFLQEAQVLGMLTHPHILPLIDVGIDEGTPYIVTAYAPLGSLKDRLEDQSARPLTLEEALTMLAQVGQALAYAHQRNIIHCDVKPANILFNARGEALLADFGIAALVETASGKRASAAGTPAYMAPEQFTGTVCKECDQYALGCVAYELVSGQQPFSALDFLAMGFKHMAEKPLAPTEFNPALPIHIEQAILKAMAKQRADRYADISTFIAALGASGISKGYLSSLPDSAMPPVASSSLARITYKKTGEEWLEEGITHMEAGRYREALDAFDHTIQLAPDDPDAYVGKGIVLGELACYKEALDAYEHAIQLAPDDADAYSGKELVLEKWNQPSAK